MNDKAIEVVTKPESDMTEQEMLKAWDAYVESKEGQTPTRLPTYDAFEAAWNARYESSNLLLREENERLRKELAEMTEDRNLWASEHSDDCPNKTLLEFAEQELATLRASASSELGRWKLAFKEGYDRVVKWKVRAEAAEFRVAVLGGMLRDYRAACFHPFSENVKSCSLCMQTDSILAPAPVTEGK